MIRLLFDQNISFRVLNYLTDIFHESTQVKIEGLETKDDMEIWHYAKHNNFSIVTFDADFSDIANLKGTPPKIIWLRTGNIRTKEIADVLNRNSEVLKDFITNSDYAKMECLEIG